MSKEPNTLTFSKDEMSEAKSLRDAEGLKWQEVAESMGVTPGKAILIYEFATCPAKEKVKDASPADVKRLRAEGLSWGKISARTHITEGSVRAMYEQATGDTAKGSRIGKGGRHPINGTKAETPKPKKATAKKAAAKAAPSAAPLKGMKSADIKTALNGFAVKYNDETIVVKEVKKANQTSIALVDGDGKARTLKTAQVTQVSKKKVL